ncbi:MAG TPA: insulinase family protein, partial [Gemmataceae bacterium]|nr:insulinase family protein [Gemmataceae bacterium]
MSSLLQRAWRLLLPLLFFLTAAPRHAEVRADDAAKEVVRRAAAALYEGIRTETLDNGLRVYLKPIPGSPVVTTMVAYKVGSADEDLDHTGLSHYLEHLMFKGTEKIMPGDIDRLTLRNGGANNASTSEDYTLYHFDMPAERWDAVLEIEADRMRNLRIDAKHEFEQEKGAVISELERDEDRHWDLESKAILPLLFGKTAPYGHPVIGERRHVRGATAAIIKAHYDKWYYPNNAALVVCGGFDSDKALAKIKKLFGPIPRAELPERKPVAAVERKGPVLKEIPSKFDVPRLLLGFNTVRTGEPDFYPLEVLQAVLAGGKTSRLYQKLIEEAEIANSVEAGNSAGRYPGWFSVQVELLKDKSRDQADKLVLAELKKLADEPIQPAELRRAKQAILANAIFAREGVHGLADSIARGVTTNDLDFLKNYLQRIAAVKAEDVQKAARKYLDPERRVVVWSVPADSDAQGGGSGARSGNRARRSARGASSEGSDGQISLKTAQRVVLDNGLTLLLFENRRLPIIVASAYVKSVRLVESANKAGVATLTGNLLSEGTAKHTGPQIATLIEDVGGTLSLHASGGTVKVLSPDRSLGLGTLFECLSQASFPAGAFRRERAQLLSLIADAERRPEEKAQQVFDALAYGNHPYGRPGLGFRKTVEALTRDDCVAFHRKLFVPNNTVVAIVGDFDAKDMMAEVTRLTAAWKAGTADKIAVPAVTKPKEVTTNIVSMPQAAQLHFYLGHVGITRNNPDYYKLLVMDYVLGRGPGFTDRLSARLRDREGLAYTVTADITSSANEQPGLFVGYVGTEAKNYG